MSEVKLKSELFLQIIVFGLTATIISLLAWRLYPKDLTNKPPPTPPSAQAILATNPNLEKDSTPNSIQIPSLNISLTVAPATVSNNNWTLYDDKVSWLVTSKTPGNGNVILYAHNRPALFGPLKNLKAGAKIKVESAGKTHVYTVKETRKISPKDIDAVITDKNQLTLYTCDGSFDEKRLIVIATADNV